MLALHPAAWLLSSIGLILLQVMAVDNSNWGNLYFCFSICGKSTKDCNWNQMVCSEDYKKAQGKLTSFKDFSFVYTHSFFLFPFSFFLFPFSFSIQRCLALNSFKWHLMLSSYLQHYFFVLIVSLVTPTCNVISEVIVFQNTTLFYI